jgi:uncharacterized repeat protein (TIGR02543 family)
MKINTTDVIRIYKQEYAYIGTSAPIGLVEAMDSDPTSKSCTIGAYAEYNGGYYECIQTEIVEMKDSSNNKMHRRTTVTFNANGGSGGSSQVKTWGVENVIEPSDPSRSGYTFLGWATTSGATSPNVTFPFTAPENNVTYYAVWEILVVRTTSPTIYNQSTTTFKWRVRNNDSSSAVIYSEHTDSTPDISRGTIVSGGYTATIDTGTPTIFGGGYTVYAQAVASGKDPSYIVSAYIEV